MSFARSARDTDSDIAFALKLADAAKAASLPHFRTTLEVTDKSGTSAGGIDPVTEADRAAERAMRALIAAERPGDGVLGEEYDDVPSDTGWTWLLDPVDGTRAFVAGLPVWTTLIALCDAEQTPQIGVIAQPVLDEAYIGWPEGAALRRGDDLTSIRVSGQDDLRRAVIATTDPFIMTPAEQGAWTHLRHTAAITRYGLDAYAYGRLAAGSIDLVAETGLAPWDMAALIPVVRGAGGLALDWRGEPATINHGQLVCAASAGIMDQALISLRRSAEFGAVKASYPDS